MNGRVSAQSRLAPQSQGNTLVFIPLPLNTLLPSSEPSAEDLRLARRLKGRARGDAALDYGDGVWARRGGGTCRSMFGLASLALLTD